MLSQTITPCKPKKMAFTQRWVFATRLPLFGRKFALLVLVTSHVLPASRQGAHGPLMLEGSKVCGADHGSTAATTAAGPKMRDVRLLRVS